MLLGSSVVVVAVVAVVVVLLLLVVASASPVVPAPPEVGTVSLPASLPVEVTPGVSPCVVDSPPEPPHWATARSRGLSRVR